jgi:hypothetical protein
MYFLQARTAEDLRRRMRCHKAIADLTYGMFGRSPDHVASYVTAMAMNPQVFDTATRTFAGNVVDYYRHTRDNDNYVAYSYCVIIVRRLCRAAFAPQQGQRGKFFTSALINRTRMVAIEFGMWRSGRKGGSSGSIMVG